MAGAAAIPSHARADEAQSYKDASGQEVVLPHGAASFADAVAGYQIGVPEPTAKATDPARALGKPDYDGNDQGGSFVSLGCGGRLTVKFNDNALLDGPGPDLHIFEVGANVESTMVEISPDGKSWLGIGQISGGRASIDIAPYISQSQQFRYVRLTDMRTACDDPTFPGADIDAIAAIGSTGAIVASIGFVLADRPDKHVRVVGAGQNIRVEVIYTSDPGTDTREATITLPPDGRKITVPTRKTENPLRFLSDPVQIAPAN
jgi:hypothetical protein